MKRHIPAAAFAVVCVIACTSCSTTPSLSGDISRFARDKYALMRADGPNDGLTLLPDVLAPNSLSILSPATDHFFAEDAEIDRKTLALPVTILERLPATPPDWKVAIHHGQP